MPTERSYLIKAAIIGLCIILTGMVLGNAFKKRNSTEDSISVVGLGTKNFTSDEILFSGNFTVKAQTAKEALAQITAQKEMVARFFQGKGFKAEEIVFSGVSFNKQYRSVSVRDENQYTRTEQVFEGYSATQSISISSKKNTELMRRIERVADQTSELVNSGVEFEPNAIQYTYSDLASLKQSLIENATKDAKERAEKIVKNANGDLGKLKDASMGVFQITGAGADVEDTYGGNYDLYNKDKEARITVRLTYELE